MKPSISLALVTVALLGSTVAAQPDPTAGTLNSVEAKLLRFDTVGARRQIEPVFDEHNARHLRAMGAILEQEGRYGMAATSFRKASRLLPKDPAALVSLGQTLLRSTATTNPAAKAEADAALKKARTLAAQRLTAEPRHFLSAYYLGLAHRGMQQYPVAIEKLNAARKLKPGNAAVLLELGTTYAFAQQWQLAFDTLSAAIDANSAIAYAYYYRGLAADKIGRKDLLITDLDRFVSLAPKAPEAAQATRVLAAARR